MSNTAAPPPAPTPYQPPQPPRSNGLATAGFVVALIGLLICWIPIVNFLGIVLGVLGVILAAVGLGSSKRLGTGGGLAIAGLVLGVLAVIGAIVVNAAFVDAVDEALSEETDTEVTTPEGAPAAADSEAGRSRDTPAPFGSAVAGSDWTVTVNSVTTADRDKYDQSPESGMTLLIVNFTATYTGDDPQGESAWASISFVSADGTTYSGTDAIFIADNQFDWMKTIYTGASLTGDEMIQVPNGWESGVLAVSPDMFSDDTFVALP